MGLSKSIRTMLMKYTSNNTKETQKIAKDLARKIVKNGPQKRAIVLALQGNLGAGKTTFLQGFAKGLGIKEKVLSPTFVVQKRFPIKKSKFKHFYHIDCYRLENAEDIMHLDFKKNINNPENIIAIEWPERISRILPQKIIRINFRHLRNNSRKIKHNQVNLG